MPPIVFILTIQATRRHLEFSWCIWGTIVLLPLAVLISTECFHSMDSQCGAGCLGSCKQRSPKVILLSFIVLCTFLVEFQLQLSFCIIISALHCLAMQCGSYLVLPHHWDVTTINTGLMKNREKSKKFLKNQHRKLPTNHLEPALFHYSIHIIIFSAHFFLLMQFAMQLIIF